MFKIGQIKNVDNEKLDICFVTHENCRFENGKTVSEEIKTLAFEISGKDYVFSFELNCKLEELLNIQMKDQVDFSSYVLGGEIWLNIRGLNGINPEIDIKATRYLKNRFIILITFFTDYSYDNNDYAGMIEFSFNLDDYLESVKEIEV